MAIEFGESYGTMHHNYAEILPATNPGDTDWHSVDLSDTVPLGTKAIYVDAHVTSTNTDDELRMASNGTPDHYHHIVTNVANKESAQSAIIKITEATRLVWWSVSNSRVTNVELHMFGSFR